MKARLALIVVCAFGTIVASTTPAIAGAPEIVLATEKWELLPAASSTYQAWTVARIRGDRFRSNVFAQAIGDDTPFRVNPQGTQASTGGIDGSTLAYDREGDIALVDLSTRTELDVPDGVNKPNAGEHSASISGTHLLFSRVHRNRSSIVLFDMGTGTSNVLYTRRHSDRRFYNVFAGQVNGNFAVWGQDTFSSRDNALLRADVWLHDIAGDTTTKLAKPAGTVQYGPSVDADGTVYLGRSGFGCGKDVQLVERPLEGTESVLYEFPDGRDFATSEAVVNVDGTTDVYFDPGRCRGFPPNQDIWRLPAV